MSGQDSNFLQTSFPAKMELGEGGFETDGQNTSFLPNEILNKIFRLLDTKTLFAAAQVCEQWQAVSELSMSRRITLTKYKFADLHKSHKEDRLLRQCENWYTLKIDDREAITKPVQDYEEDIGILTSLNVRGLNNYRDLTRDNSNRELLCREAFLYLPLLKWAQNVTVLVVDVPNLSSRDVNEVAPLLLKELKSMKSLKIKVNWYARKTAARGRGGAPPRALVPSEMNTSMEKLKVVYDVEADEERRRTSENVFVNVKDFVAICWELKTFKIQCSVGLNIYKIYGDRLNSKHWDVDFSLMTSRINRRLNDHRFDVKSIIAGIPIEVLRVRGKNQLALVEDIIGDSHNLRQVALSSLFRDACTVTIPEVVQRWSSNPAFENVTDLSIGVPDSEADFSGVGEIQVGSFLKNVTKLQLIQHETHNLDPSSRPKMLKFSEAYWTSLLGCFPNVQLLVTNWPSAAFRSQAKLLKNLRHVVRLYSAVDDQDLDFFQSQELNQVVDSLKGLKSYTLDFQRTKTVSSDGEIEKLKKNLRSALRILRRSSVELLQLNTSILLREVLSNQYAEDTGGSNVTIRFFNVERGHLFRYVMGVSLESCDSAVQTGENHMAPNITPDDARTVSPSEVDRKRIRALRPLETRRFSSLKRIRR